MISNKHILLTEAEDVLVYSGASSSEAARALAPFRFVLSCEVLVQRGKLSELLDCLEREREDACGC